MKQILIMTNRRSIQSELNKFCSCRLLLTGSLEEKIYQRQISKQGISGSVVDARTDTKVQFSTEELKVKMLIFIRSRSQLKFIIISPMGSLLNFYPVQFGHLSGDMLG